jgi:hypothetical protein
MTETPSSRDPFIDREARLLAKQAMEQAKTATQRADNAVQISRTANDAVMQLDATMKSGFSTIENSLGGKVDALIDDLRSAKAGGSLRPKLESMSGVVLELESERLKSAERLAKLEAAESERNQAKEAAIAAEKKAEAEREARLVGMKKMARRMGVAYAIAFAGALGTATAVWMWQDAKERLERKGHASHVAEDAGAGTRP